MAQQTEAVISSASRVLVRWDRDCSLWWKSSFRNEKDSLSDTQRKRISRTDRHRKRISRTGRYRKRINRTGRHRKRISRMERHREVAAISRSQGKFKVR